MGAVRDLRWRLLDAYLNTTSVVVARHRAWFPDRQIILRQHGSVHALRVSARVQTGAALMLASVALWTVVATGGYWYSARKIEQKQHKIAFLEAHHQALVDEIAQERLKANEIASALTHYQDDRLSLAAVDADQPARSAIDLRVHELERALQLQQNHVVLLETQLRDDQQILAGAEQARRSAVAERDALGSQVAMVERNAVSAKKQQEATIAVIAEHARAVISDVENVLASTGVDARKLAAAGDRDGRSKVARGGPFVPYRGQDKPDRPHAEHAVLSTASRLDTDLARLDQLRQVLHALPLSSPLHDFTVSDGYGYRIDPFYGRGAFHEGLDMAAAMRTQIRATGPGVVVAAGWQHDYGRVVEIDHGYNIHTIYAHLDRILVTPGTHIGINDVVGLLGRTGRATGPHLHYEVRVDGRPRDPVNFLRATAHVFTPD